ncbi:MAG: CPBP family intramembrane glutamate endopeptidase, partial [Tenacibaculum sp.]
MNYIQQAYRGELGLWKYLIYPLFFFGLMGLNFVAISILDLDMDKMIQEQIATKGANRFLIESLIPFAIGLGLLFLWVKYIHK